MYIAFLRPFISQRFSIGLVASTAKLHPDHLVQQYDSGLSMSSINWMHESYPAHGRRSERPAHGVTILKRPSGLSSKEKNFSRSSLLPPNSTSSDSMRSVSPDCPVRMARNTS